MDPTFARPLDESLIRELPQFQSVRIAPLRQPVSSRALSVPSPLEPNASGVRESSTVSKPNSNASVPETLPTLTEFLNAARTKKNGSAVESLLSFEPPPKPILPAFVNLRALERFPYSSFDDDNSHAHKRRRLALQPDTFSEHLQLPRPQAQKERPPPFGPFAILNGLNEPPPNAALLPPIEAGSIPQLLNKPTKDSPAGEHSVRTTKSDGQDSEKREGRIEEILDSPIDDKAVDAVRGPREERPTGTHGIYEDRNHTVEIGTKDVTEDRNKDSDSQPTENSEPLSPKTRGRSRKNTRRWTDEETTALLRGVLKCGIGNWKTILAQPELKFNKRTASNLKDRFRVCCPWAYRDPKEAMKQLHDTLANSLLRSETKDSDKTAETIYLRHLESGDSNIEPTSVEENTIICSKKEQPSGASSTGVDSKNHKPRSIPLPSPKTTLEPLGIYESNITKGNRRRSRRPFTAAEDEALLKGYAVHGFQWTLIQQDQRLNLSHRRATDLRDRFRNKFPDAYRDGGSVSGKTLQGQDKGAETDSGPQATVTNKWTPQDTRRNRGRDSNSTRYDDVFSGKTLRYHVKDSQLSAGQGNSQDDRGEKASSSKRPDNAKGPTRPQALLPDASIFQLSFDDRSTESSSADTWEDNTLRPMVWDELA